MTPAIDLRGVGKRFGDKVAVEALDLSVPRGALYGLIGPNGAGKTTTIRMVMSILFPDRGEIRVLGHRSALEAKDRVGYLPEERGLYKKMRVGSFLRLMGRLKSLGGAELEARIGRWLERVDLPGVESKRCDELSKGMQQKVQFVAAVLHEPELLILDEPFGGLDPVNMRRLRELIRELAEEGRTIVFSTHVMAQAEQVCRHIVMLDEGRKVLDRPLAEIRAEHDPRALVFEPFDPAADPAPLLELPEVAGSTRVDGAWHLELADGVEAPRAVAAVAARLPSARVELLRPSLEDVFVRIVAGGGTGEEARALRDALRSEATPGGTSGASGTGRR